jgi:hypothetical protein
MRAGAAAMNALGVECAKNKQLLASIVLGDDHFYLSRASRAK